ncbi:hypothetical protein MP228_009032 [Amoeboaphelidium protococcarum]|nr:hypothetical protein MP228_009032 [Amoeboaphelidium protococcarum]
MTHPVGTANQATMDQVNDLFSKLSVGKETAPRAQVASELVRLVKSSHDIHFLKSYQIIDKIKIEADNAKSAPAREGAMLTFAALCKDVPVCDPYLLPLLPIVLERMGDKAQEVRKAADEAGLAFIERVNPHAVKAVLPVLYEAIEHGIKWQTKFGGLALLRALTKKAPQQIRLCLPDIIPHASAAMWDTKSEVNKSAAEAMAELCKLVGNPDIEAFIPALIRTIANPSEVPECVYQLAATTFVTTVESPALAIMLPLLVRGLGESVTAVKRQTAVIIDNMCKLVLDPAQAEFFIPKLLPGLDRIIEVAADPDLRSVAERARKTMLKAGGFDHKLQASDIQVAVKWVSNVDNLMKVLKDIVSAQAPSHKDEMKDQFFVILLQFVCTLASELVEHKCFEEAEWVATIKPYLSAFLSADESANCAKEFLKVSLENIQKETEEEEEEEEEGEDLCDCEFSLAYGGMILLNSTKLHLKRGHRYGLCGANGVGKSTLMRAIANGQLDGFPPQDVLKSVFVEHKLQASDAEILIMDFVQNDDMTKDVEKDVILKTLESVGFDEEMRAKKVGELSGGWKMKLELARAIMVNADILLLDEPTNHLDKRNVKWLTDYLNSLSNVTSLIVSHDSTFLDNVCTDILHYENRKLKRYRGNLSEFVKIRPEAKAYYNLTQSQYNFKLPEPGFLDGVNTKDKAIIKLVRVGFRYPGSDKDQLSGVSVACSLSSRIAVLGPNGAGKSTLIKVLTGETIPTAGDVIRHPNLRICYVAQHAFHHLDRHLDKTPNQYIQWRYQFGEDKELLEKESRQMTDADKKVFEQQVVFDGQKRKLESLMGRRKLKKSFEYEVKWVNMTHEENSWVPRDKLEEWGFNKIVQKFDDKEAAKAGAYTRPLTAANVQKHLEDLGLDPEFATHSFIKGLSGGQKVKVVIGASTWNNPHMLVLDEPSNYLDRDSLAALSQALKEFGGGVIVISHNQEFVDAVCTERWNMDNGLLQIEGQTTAVKEKIVQKEEEEMVDAFGNVSKVKSQKTLTKKEQRQKDRAKKAKKKQGQDVSDDDDIEAQLAALSKK